jgi:pimeloyl-ACP methyl ester carboxylesterase
MHIRPFDYYKNINIPILFIHGRSDSTMPGESTAYIQENLPEKPFVYWYFPWAHQPGNLEEMIQFGDMVAKWIRETDK